MSIAAGIKQKTVHLGKWFLKLSFQKKLLVIAGIAVVAWVTVPRVLSSKQKVSYQTAQVQRGSVISSISESGNVSTVSQTTITSPTDGVITELDVANGDLVVVGQTLFKVKSTATEQQKASAYAAYLSAVNSTKTAQQSKIGLQAQLEQARQSVLDAQSAVDSMNFNRSNNSGVNPSTKQPYTQNEMDSIQSALTSAHENFTAVEAKYNQADTSIGASSASQTAALLAYQATQDSEVKAPIDGTVANLSTVVGSNVSSSGGGTSSSSSSSSTSSSSSASSSSSPVMIIGNFSNLTIKAQVNEVDIPNIRAGQKATITLDAFPDKTFVGNVVNVDSIGASSSGVVTYNAYINLIDPPATIQPGMSASVVIQTARSDNALYVPSSAVQTVDGSSYVRELKNGQLTQVPVEVGISSDTDIEITSGVSEGDTIVTSILTPSTASTTGTTSPFSGLSGNRGFGGGGNFGGGGRGAGGAGGRTVIRGGN
jgi:macrolide-specific efflux system membrane fusion protein